MTADDTVTCSVCDEEITLGGSAHETWDGNDVTFWCETHCPDCRQPGPGQQDIFGGNVTPTEIRAALHRIESTTQILDLRTSGNSNLIPAFEKYTNAQLCASMLRELIELTDHYKTEAG